MPAMLEDPTAPLIYRNSGEMPYPLPGGPLPLGIAPRQVTLRDRVTIATIIPFSSFNQVPVTLLAYLSDQFSREIEKGDTYPMLEPLPLEAFGPYWFGVFGAIMLLGDIESIEEVHRMARQGHDWEKACLGSFYIKPNYPGRSSHICNGGFLVTDGARNRGVGRLMGETYLEWAPKLGYTYSVFNLVYETNVASCRIWDALGFKRIGRVKGCGSLRSYPGEFVDAIIYGRDLGQDDDFVSEERFDKIRFYLKNGKYPNGADRAEKSRLRSAATHYKLIPPAGEHPEKLMLKGKEVISDPQRQYEIAREVHHRSHGGINKTTAAIAESFHWVRIKETVSQVIRNCPECSEMNKGLSNVRTSTGGQQTRFVQQQQPGYTRSSLSNQTSMSSQQSQGQGDREESPSDQLQMEAAQHQTHSSHHHDTGPASFVEQLQFNASFDMPLDPQLMDPNSQSNHAHFQNANHNHNHTSSHSNPNQGSASTLGDLPPSPFLAAGRTLQPVSQMSGLDHLPPPDLPPPLSLSDPDGDVGMGDVVERAPSARQELRRRLTRAGYAAK